MAYAHTIMENGEVVHRAEIDDAFAMNILTEAEDTWNVRELPDGDYTWEEGDVLTHYLIKI